MLVAKSKKRVKGVTQTLVQSQRETCVEQDEVDEKSLTSPDAGVMIWNAGRTCARETILLQRRAFKVLDDTARNV